YKCARIDEARGEDAVERRENVLVLLQLAGAAVIRSRRALSFDRVVEVLARDHAGRSQPVRASCRYPSQAQRRLRGGNLLIGLRRIDQGQDLARLYAIAFVDAHLPHVAVYLGKNADGGEGADVPRQSQGALGLRHHHLGDEDLASRVLLLLQARSFHLDGAVLAPVDEAGTGSGEHHQHREHDKQRSLAVARALRRLLVPAPLLLALRVRELLQRRRRQTRSTEPVRHWQAPVPGLPILRGGTVLRAGACAAGLGAKLRMSPAP